MTAQNSASKAFYNFKPYFLYKLRYLRPLFIMNCIFALLSYPTVGMAYRFYFLAQNAYYSYATVDGYTEQLTKLLAEYNFSKGIVFAAAVICVICLIGLFIFTLVTTLRAFRYLYNKNVVDMDYSLPINHNTRFCGDLLAVFSTSILPHIAAVLIGLVIIYTMPQAYNFSSELMQKTYSDIANCMCIGLLSCVMQISFTLLTISFCGRIAESVIYPVLLNIAVPVIHGLGAFIVGNCFYGSDFASDTYFADIGNTSPLGMIINAAVFGRFYYVVPAIITVLLIAASYFLIKRRLNRRVGMSYVYKGMNLIIPGIVMLAITMPLFFEVWRCIKGFGSTINYYSYAPSPIDAVPWAVGAIISTFILYIIMELIGGRNFRKFHLTLAKWAGTLAVCFGITSCLCLSDGMGQKYYVPAQDDVTNVYFTIGTSYVNSVSSWEFAYVSTSDPYAVETAIELHSLVCKSDYSETGNTGNSFGVSYYTKNGSLVSRSYYVSDSLYNQIIDRISTPQWFMAVMKSRFKISPNAEYIVESVRLSGEETEYINYAEKCIDMDSLLAALEKDSEKANRHLMFEQDNDNYYMLRILTVTNNGRDTEYGNLNIHPWMTNTLQALGLPALQ